MITFWQAIILMAAMFLSMISAFFLGAFFVFKSKRETHENLIGGPRKGEAFSIDDLGGEVIPDAKDTVPQSIQRRTSDFISQLADKIGDN